MNRLTEHLAAVAYRAKFKGLFSVLAMSALFYEYHPSRCNLRRLRKAALRLWRHEKMYAGTDVQPDVSDRERPLVMAALEFGYACFGGERAEQLARLQELATSATRFARDGSDNEKSGRDTR